MTNISSEKYKEFYTNKLKECTENFPTKSWIFDMIQKQLDGMYANQSLIKAAIIQNDFDYYFAEPSTFDTGSCSEIMLKGVTEFIATHINEEQ
jgi:hypothetical protein